MVIFNSYVSLPEGTYFNYEQFYNISMGVKNTYSHSTLHENHLPWESEGEALGFAHPFFEPRSFATATGHIQDWLQKEGVESPR